MPKRKHLSAATKAAHKKRKATAVPPADVLLSPRLQLSGQTTRKRYVVQHITITGELKCGASMQLTFKKLGHNEGRNMRI